MAGILAAGSVCALAQDEGPTLPRTQSKPKAAGATLLVLCDLACNWKLDGEAQGHIDAGGSAKVKVGLGQHLVEATAEDGADQVKHLSEVKNAGQTVVNIELQPVRNARLKAEQEAEGKAAREQAAQQEAVRQRAMEVQESRNGLARQQTENEKVPHEETGKPVDIMVKDPVEFNAYQNAASLNEPRAKAAAYESFLASYPGSVLKTMILDQLLGIYSSQQDVDDTGNAASRLLQIDPNNMKAVLYVVILKKGQCSKTQDAQTCNDAAALAQKGLGLTRAAGITDANWQQIIHAAFPIFHSAIALDAVTVNKDYRTAEDEYMAELRLYSDQEEKTTGLSDALQLAQAYSAPGNGQDLKKAVWFYAWVWNFAPAQFQAEIELRLEYYYGKYHGGLDGLDALKQRARTSTFPYGEY